MPEPVNYNDRCLIIGKTGSGKTLLAARLASAMRGAQLRVCDPKGRLDFGVEPARSLGAIDWRQRIVHYVPATFSRDEYAELYDAFYRAGGPAVVWTDEASGVGPTTGNYAPQGMVAIQAQGRELGIGHIVCAQRPVTIAVPLRTEAEHYFIFGQPPPAEDDLRQLAADIGLRPDELAGRMRELAAREGLPPLNKYTFLWWHRESGALADCAPLHLG